MRPLVEEGRKQAELLGKFLRDNQDRYPIDRIISSDLERTQRLPGKSSSMFHLRLSIQMSGERRTTVTWLEWIIRWPM